MSSPEIVGRKQELMWAKEEPSPSSWVAPGIPSGVVAENTSLLDVIPVHSLVGSPPVILQSGLDPESQEQSSWRLLWSIKDWKIKDDVKSPQVSAR